MPHRIIKTVDGRRGSFLTLSGVMFLPVSVTYLFAAERPAVLDWAPGWVTLPMFGAIFAVAAFVALIIGLFSKKLGPEVVGHGYMAAMSVPLIACGIHVIAALHGTHIAWAAAMLEAGWAASIYLASAWPNPPQTPPAVDDAEVP